jgi:UDP-N-acetylmuramate dehydrogenase
MKWSDGSLKDFSLEECQFGYRDSFFKQHKGEYLILSVRIQLSKNPSNFKISYGDIQDTLKQMEVWIPNVKAISDAVIKIRSSKLPDPKVLGNAGSFFKNPVISFEKAQELKETYPLIPLYPQQDSSVKVAAGWLIEQCGWKGKICGNTGNHAKQSLVIVNYGNASGQEIKAHALKVQQSVKEKFGVHLEPEVNFVPN